MKRALRRSSALIGNLIFWFPALAPLLLRDAAPVIALAGYDAVLHVYAIEIEFPNNQSPDDFEVQDWLRQLSAASAEPQPGHSSNWQLVPLPYSLNYSLGGEALDILAAEMLVELGTKM